MASSSAAEKIFGKYHLVDKIATGGMAEVFRAKSYGVAGFEKTLVIKKILPNLASDKKFVEMFIDEAKIASTLSHINIVQIFDLGSEDGDYFIAMEFVDGTDLKTLVEKARTARRAVPVNLMAYVTSEVAKGLDYAHRRKDAQRRDLNIVHRDISPHNVLVSHAGEVKITDFGIARASSKVTITRSGVIRGKFAYMSPEQARGDSIDRRSDIFSLGIVLYEVLTGTRLFKSKNDLETLKRVQTGPITPPSRLNPEVAPELESIVLKSLDRDRDRRYQWASEFYDDLSSYLFGSGEKVGTSELSSWVGKVLGPQDEENERTTDFDAFVNAIEEIGGGKPVQTRLTPMSGPADQISRKSARAKASADEPTRLDASKSLRSGSRSAPSEEAKEPKKESERPTERRPVIKETASVEKPPRIPTPSEGGKTQAVAREAAPETLLAVDGRLVGRTEELKRIREILGRVARGEGQTLALIGEDGSGKTRLVAEMMSVSRELDVAFYLGRGRRETSAVPYASMQEILREIAGVKPGETDEQLRERVDRFAQLGLSLAEIHFVGAVFGLEYAGSAVDSFQGEDRRRGIAAAIEKVVLGLARERPVILAIDDLDLADELSRSAFDHLASVTGSKPVLILATSAGGADDESIPMPAAAASGRFHRIGLKPLSEFSTAMLARGVLGVEELGSSIADLIQARSGGNPLRVREVIRFLLGSGHLKVSRGRVLLEVTGTAGRGASAPEALFVPATAAMLCSDALSRLPESDRRIASIAAALGERFEAAMVSAVAGAPSDEALARLRDAGLVRMEESGWRFVHRLFRDAALAALPKEGAEAVHRAVARELARVPESRRAEVLPSIWTHHAAAGEVEAALEALDQAAAGLLLEGGATALLPAAESACSLIANVPLGMDAKRAGLLRVKAHLRHAVLASAAKDFDRAKGAIERARDAAEALADREAQARVEKALGDHSAARGQPEAAADHFERARKLIEEQLESEPEGSSATRLGHRRELIDYELLIARQQRIAGDPNRALRRCKEALENAQELRESTRVGSCLDELANIHERLGEHARAMKLWDLAINIWMKIGDKRSLTKSFESVGLVMLDEGDVEGAKNLFREALELAREIGDVEGTARLLNELARAHLKLRQYAPAQALFLESQAIAKRFALSTLAHLSVIYLAALTAYTTDLQEGIRALEAHLAEWEKSQPDKLGLLQAELLLGNAYKMARRVGPTNQHYVRALGYARDLGLERYVREITREMKEAF